MKTMSIAALAALLACAAQKEEVKTASQASSEAQAGAKGAPLAENPAPPGQAPQPAAVPGAQPGAPPAKEQPPPQKGETPPAAQTAQASPPAAPEPPMMPDADFRQKKPEPLAVQPHFQAPVPVERKLKNGARVLIVENHQIPLVAVDVRFLHGVDADPLTQSGLAEFVADTIDEGTSTRSAEKMSEEIEDLAAHYGAGASLESSSVNLNCLTETLPQALDLLADMVQNPAFRKDDVERVRTLKLTQLEQKKASIGALANDEANKILYGDKHPWGQPSGGTPASLASITPEDLAKFHATWWVPNNAVISVSGDVKPAEIVKLLDEKFASWKQKPLPKLALPPLPKLTKRSIIVLDKPGATQSQVWVVGRLFAAKDPDAVAFQVANRPLGGMFTSRLNMNLREKHGYSYGVGSRPALMRSTGTLTAAGGIIAKNTVEAVAEYEKELAAYAEKGATEDELARAKEAYIRSLPSLMETNDAVAALMGNLVSLGLPLDYYKKLPDRIQKVTLKEVARVAAKWVKPQAMPIVIVGPVGQSKEALEKLGYGPVTIQPAQAAPAKPAAGAGQH